MADTSTAVILGGGWIRNLLGPRLIGGTSEIETRRVETANGWTVEAGHDFYVRLFGIRHERELTLSPQGLALTGSDRLLPACAKPKLRFGEGRPQKGRSGGEVTFAVRFHIHPDVRVSRAQSGDVILKLPNGEGWRFRCGAPVTVEESIYLGSDTVRRAEQLVITGTVKDAQVEIDWIFEQIGSG